MARLRRVRDDGPGISRHRRGRGFTYRDERGKPVRDPETLKRIRALVLPPAWEDVWICSDPLGHLQAAGTDTAGRRQYRYHDVWRQRRDAQKFDRMLEFARSLPAVRERVSADLDLERMPKDRVLAGAVRILDRASFRIGSESYARRNGSFGLATLRRDHVRVQAGALRFDFAAKSGRRRIHELRDAQLVPVVRTLKRRRGGGPELLAYREGSAWRDVRSADINLYIKDAGGNGFSAKDFRTWQGTVIAAVALALAEAERTERMSRRRQISAAVNEVAEFLGNTPAVARRSYIDPRLIDRFDEGVTILGALDGLDADSLDDPDLRASIEAAVLDLLAGAPEAVATAA